MQNVIFTTRFSSPCGELLLGSYEDAICLCDWVGRKKRDVIDERIKKGLQGHFVSGTSQAIERAIEQLNEYFHGDRTTFNIPLRTIGSPFQKAVWEHLIGIPFGRTISYYQLSQKMNNTKAIRAVSSANGANAISIFIPCHRVVGTSGELTGYAGGLTCKKKLLELETKHCQTELF